MIDYIASFDSVKERDRIRFVARASKVVVSSTTSIRKKVSRGDRESAALPQLSEKEEQDMLVLMHTGPLGLGNVIDRYVKVCENGSHAVRFLDGSIIGNSNDSPLYAMHKRRHHWEQTAPQSKIKK